ILLGDNRIRCRELPAGIVKCTIESPPFWRLRVYDAPNLVWGDDPACDHDFDMRREILFPGDRGQNAARQRAWKSTEFEHGFCRKCNAWNGQLGLEPTVELYAEHIVECCREQGRLLADDGTLWLNLGDRFLDKDLLGIPWTVVNALKKEDGWIC